MTPAEMESRRVAAEQRRETRMGLITLYCEEASELKLGPSNPPDLVFRDSFCTFEADDYPAWREWAFHPGTPRIRVLEEFETAPGAGPNSCPVCDRSFVSPRAVNGHLLSHRPKPNAPVTAQEGIRP
jgi:hypothetical protein